MFIELSCEDLYPKTLDKVPAEYLSETPQTAQQNM